MKSNIPKKLELIELIKYAQGEIEEWTAFIKDLQKKLEKLDEKN